MAAQLNKEIAAWFDKASKSFERFSASRFLENDTECNVDDLKDAFVAWYKAQTGGKTPPGGLFTREVIKRCKGKEDPTQEELDEMYEDEQDVDFLQATGFSARGWR